MGHHTACVLVYYAYAIGKSVVVIHLFGYYFIVSFQQIIVFICLSVVLFLISRPIVKKLNKTKSENSTVESLIGEEVVVIKEIPVGGIGEIKAQYERYSAIALECDHNISIDTKCIIKEIRGNKVIVEEKK